MDSKIIIPNPCQENWRKMTPEEQGRHCAVCNKVVKDFTKMKTEEIITSLKNTEAEICGRINVKELTPANTKQQIYFWMNGLVFRKAIYPILALLGVTFLNKKAQAQTHDYPLKGKIALSNYQTNSKKITVVVKTNIGNHPIIGANINIVSGIQNHQESLITDDQGRFIINIQPEDLLSNEVEIEITATGYEYKKVKIKVTKDIQIVEITMEDEFMMMGEMMIMPNETTPNIIEPILVDTPKKIEVTKCTILTIQSLPQIPEEIPQINNIEPITKDIGIQAKESSFTDKLITNKVNKLSAFSVFPVPSYNQVNIISSNEENFNMDIFDGSGKKLHSIINTNTRYTLDVSGYPAGVYYILITVNGEAIETKKIIVANY